MFSPDYLVKYINSAISKIKYPDEPSGLYEPIKYTLSDGGKRLRPLLTLATCDALGGDIDGAKNQAIGVEIFHNFTLLHDDVMDNADMRRGKATVHRKWNEATAILSGDAMLTLATQFMTKGDGTKIWDVISLFNTTAMEVYQGQQYDMDFEKRPDVTVVEYLEMIRLKTSVLLGCACKLGAIMAGAFDSEQKAFYKYGVKLGLAFQLQDDFLDTYGDPNVFGKKIGGDILNDKKTWLLISALNEDNSGKLKEIIGNKEIASEEKITQVKAIYDSLNLGNRCKDLMGKYATEAIDALKTVGLSDTDLAFFKKMASDAIGRNH
ncbi:MAG: polyprenyl synthetase family protein [Muribaculaceae bacterium]|nr:polyprenyl synthetase family protein [Muribaculaceae bacterium]